MLPVAQINLEHAQGNEQIAKSVREVRGSMREIAAALTSHAKSASGSAETLAVVARDLSSLRELNAEQVQAMTAFTDTFDGSPNDHGSAEPLA